MMCYKDITFCVNKTCKKECDRRLTEEIELKAARLNLYLSFADFDREGKDED